MTAEAGTAVPPAAVPEAAIIDAWCQSLRMAYTIARGRRLAELRRERGGSFDYRGLHVFSAEAGRVLALEDLVPDLALAGFDAKALLRAAEQDAQDDWIKEVVEGERAGT